MPAVLNVSGTASAPVSDSLIAFAHGLADRARPVTLKHFRRQIAIEDKEDASPVTIADRESESTMREAIEAAHPDHGIYGEEHGVARRDAEWLWMLDPIDGTKAFITGKPLFGILVALLHRGKPVLGVVDLPALDVRYVGVAGRPSTRNGQPIRARPCRNLGDAWLYATTPEMFRPGVEEDAFARLKKRVKHPVFGGDCLAYGLLSEGFVDLVVEATMKPFDYMALVPVVEGAGGVITDWHGRALGIESTGQVLAAGDRARHADARAILTG